MYRLALLQEKCIGVHVKNNSQRLRFVNSYDQKDF